MKKNDKKLALPILGSAGSAVGNVPSLRSMAELGSGPHRSGDIAPILKKEVQGVAPTRATLISKGMRKVLVTLFPVAIGVVH